jgi:hypothetical protein
VLGSLLILRIRLSRPATTAIQETVAEGMLFPVNALVLLTAVGSIPVRFAPCGPFARLIGVQRVSGLGAVIILLSVAALLCSPEISRFGRRPGQARPRHDDGTSRPCNGVATSSDRTSRASR